MERPDPIIITAALTGGGAEEGLPITMEDQLRESVAAYEAGACMVHLHRRSALDPALMSADSKEYYELNAAIRDKCPDLIINNTSGGNKALLADGSVSEP